MSEYTPLTAAERDREAARFIVRQLRAGLDEAMAHIEACPLAAQPGHDQAMNCPGCAHWRRVAGASV